MSTSVFKSSQRSTPLGKNLSKNFHIARHVFLVAAPIGIVVGAAVAGYDYVVNGLLWGPFSSRLNPIALSLLPIIGMALTGAILAIFRVTSSSMADEVVLAYHRPEAGINYRQALPKLGASIATMGFGASAGMEGASKWLGGTISSYIQSMLNRSRRLKPLHGKVETTMIAGASAGIAGDFPSAADGRHHGCRVPL